MGQITNTARNTSAGRRNTNGTIEWLRRIWDGDATIILCCSSMRLPESSLLLRESSTTQTMPGWCLCGPQRQMAAGTGHTRAARSAPAEPVAEFAAVPDYPVEILLLEERARPFHAV